MRLILTFLLLATPALAQVEARSLAVSDHTLYVGTSVGSLWTSHDNGETWQGLAVFGKQYIINKILVTPKEIYVATEIMGNPYAGDFFRSPDGGKTWQLTEHKAFRALAFSHDRLWAGGPSGVYESLDAGESWTKASKEIKDVQSIAADSTDGRYVFVGTWHLGYYSHDGGADWHSIHKGVINDSDFFAILLDDNTIYIGACSGIYKGHDDGQQYTKLHNKKDARRTKVIVQANHNLLYAGTTDGVFVSPNAGGVWKRRGNRNIVVNDMLVQGTGHLIVATSRFGVLISDDGGQHFHNSQFAE